MDVYLSATEAAAFLGVAKPTLYAYVSRGLVRSQPGADSRARTYNRLDLEQLQARKRIRNRPQAEVAAALHWGAPLLDSSLTLITKDGLYYRGSSALELASADRSGKSRDGSGAAIGRCLLLLAVRVSGVKNAPRIPFTSSKAG